MKIPLPQGAGYAIVLGLGFTFAIGMILTTYVLRRYQKEVVTSEEFSTAGRSVGTGLIAASVVSSWTWAATLLTSTTQGYKNGVAGPYYYASGACCQIILFAFLAIKAKQLAPECHTYLEIVRARYGGFAHGVFIFFAIVTNILVTAMLLTGGSAAISDLTGMNTVACIFLLPLGVMLYTLFGGIKATFLTDYVHTIAIIVIIMTFAFTAYATSDKLGSPGKIWELVTAAGERHPISGNTDGSYLTMHSRSGGIFFVINIIGNFGTVFLDNGYWNKAIASSPVAALPGYVLGGLSWFPIPWLTATTMGLSAIALETNPSFPSYPDRLSTDDVSAGLVLPSAAVAMMGKGGAVASLFMVFMAVTSASSAELIAVSSIVSYDIYKQYIRPNATGKSIIFVSHVAVVCFCLIMAGLATGLYYAGISMGWLYEAMGIMISAAVVPASLTMLWKQQNAIAAAVSPILGTILSIMSWLVCTHCMYGEVTVDNTFMDDPMLVGNVVALLSPLIFIPILTYVFKPQNFDWNVLKSIKKVDETPEIEHVLDDNKEDEEEAQEGRDSDTKKFSPAVPTESKVESIIHVMSTSQKELMKAKDDEELLRKASKKAGYLCLFLAIAMLVVWPMPMYGSKYVFSKKFYTGWVVVGMIWIFFSAFCVILLPLWQGRHDIYTSFRGIYWDLTGQTYKLREWQTANPQEMHVVKSQVSIEARRQLESQGDDPAALDEVLK